MVRLRIVGFVTTSLISTDGRAFLQAGAIRLAYQTYGRDDDPAVVLIMGLNGQMIAWPDEFCRRLADRGLRVIRFDNRDVGESTHLPGPGSPVKTWLGAPPPYRLADMAGDTAGLVTALVPGGAHLVGISMGGMIAQTLTVLRPDLVRSLTSMCSTTGNPRVGRPTPGVALKALLLRRPRTRDERIAQSVDILRRISSPGYPFDLPAVTALAGAAYDRDPDPTGGRRQFAAVVAAPDRTAGLGRISVPTLVLHGMADPLIDVSGGVTTADAIPTARLRTFAGMGHDLPHPLWDTFIDEIATTVSAAEPGRG